MKSSTAIIALTLVLIGTGVLWHFSGREISQNMSIQTFTQTQGPVLYSVDVPTDWYPYQYDQSGRNVIFTKNPDLRVPQNTESYAVGPNFTIAVNNITDITGVTTYDEWFQKNGMSEESEFFIEKKPVTVRDLQMFRVLTHGAGVAGDVVHYVYFVDVQRVVILSQFPYDQSSEATQTFETVVQTFKVPARQSGGDGLLPPASGITGTVSLGPTCPVMRNPIDPQCADKPYKTTLRIIETGSMQSSTFITVDTDTSGQYDIMLPPGQYDVQAVGSTPFPSCESKTILVKSGEIVEADFSCDTGIR